MTALTPSHVTNYLKTDLGKGALTPSPRSDGLPERAVARALYGSGNFQRCTLSGPGEPS
jgi:hypothetical protein